jgi:hypothetical protein
MLPLIAIAFPGLAERRDDLLAIVAALRDET